MASLRQKVNVPKFGLISKAGTDGQSGTIGLFKSMKGLKGADLRYAIGYNLSTLRAFGVPISSKIISLPYDFQQSLNTFKRGAKFLQTGQFTSTIGRRAGVLAFASRGAPKLRSALIPRTSSRVFNRYLNIAGGSIIQREIIGPISRGKSKKDVIEAIFRPEVIERTAKKEFTSNKSDNFLFKWQQATYMRAVAGAPDPIRNNAFVQAKAYKDKPNRERLLFDSRYGIIKDNGELIYQSDAQFEQIMSLIDRVSLPEAETEVQGVVQSIMNNHMGSVLGSEDTMASRRYRAENAAANKARNKNIMNYYYNLSGTQAAYESGTDGLEPSLNAGGDSVFENVVYGGTGKGQSIKGIELVNKQGNKVDGYTNNILKKYRDTSESSLLNAIEKDKAKLGKQFEAIYELASKELMMLANNLGLPTPDFSQAGAFGLANEAYIKNLADAITRVGTYQTTQVNFMNQLGKSDYLAFVEYQAILDFIIAIDKKGFNGLARTLLNILSPKIGSRNAKTPYLAKKMKEALVAEEATGAKQGDFGKGVTDNDKRVMAHNEIYGGWFKQGLPKHRRDLHAGIGIAFMEGGGLVISDHGLYNVGVSLNDVYIDPALVDYYLQVNRDAKNNSDSGGSRIYKDLKAEHRARKRREGRMNSQDVKKYIANQTIDPDSKYYIGDETRLKTELKAYVYSVFGDKSALFGKKGLFGIPTAEVYHPLHDKIKQRLQTKYNVNPNPEKIQKDIKDILKASVISPAGNWSQVRPGLNNDTKIPSDLPNPFNASQLAFEYVGAEKKERRLVDITTNNKKLMLNKKERAYRGISKADDNFVPNKIQIAESIHIIPIHQKGPAFITAEVIAGTSSAKVGHADLIRDIERIEYGGHATDSHGGYTKRTDGMVYLPSLFFTRACEEAAAYLGFTDSGRILGFDKTLQKKVGVKFRLGKGQYTSAARAFKQKESMMERNIAERGIRALRNYRRDIKTTILKGNYSFSNKDMRRKGQRIMQAFRAHSVAGGNDRYIEPASIIRSERDDVLSSLPGLNSGLNPYAFGNTVKAGTYTTGILNQGFLTSLSEKGDYDKFVASDTFAADIVQYIDSDGNIQQELGRIPYQKLFDPALVKKMISMGGTTEVKNYMKKVKQLASGRYSGGFEALSIQGMSDFIFAQEYFGKGDLENLIGTTSVDTRAHIFQTLGLGKVIKEIDKNTGQHTMKFNWAVNDPTDFSALVYGGRTYQNSPLYKLIDNIAGPGARGRLTAHYVNVINGIFDYSKIGDHILRQQFKDAVHSDAGRVARRTVTALQTILSKHSIAGGFTSVNEVMIALEKVTALLAVSASAVVDKAYFLRAAMAQRSDFEAFARDTIGKDGVHRKVFQVPPNIDLNKLAGMDVKIDIAYEGLEAVPGETDDYESLVNEMEHNPYNPSSYNTKDGKRGVGGTVQEALRQVLDTLLNDIGTSTSDTGDPHNNFLQSLIEFHKSDWVFKTPTGAANSGFEKALNEFRSTLPQYHGENISIEDGTGVVQVSGTRDMDSIDYRNNFYETAGKNVKSALDFFQDIHYKDGISTAEEAARAFLHRKVYKSIPISDLTHEPVDIQIANAMPRKRKGKSAALSFNENIILTTNGSRMYLSHNEFDTFMGNLAKSMSQAEFGVFINTLLKEAHDKVYSYNQYGDYDTLYAVLAVNHIVSRTGINLGITLSSGSIDEEMRLKVQQLHAGQIKELHDYYSNLAISNWSKKGWTAGKVNTDPNDG